MAQEWTRIEGMIIGHELDPSTVAAELKERAILAQLEWFPSSPQLLGLNVAVCDDRVATVPADSTEATPGPTPSQLAEELAILFDAEVRIGNATSDQLPDGESPLGRVWPSDEDAPETVETAPTRIARRPPRSRSWRPWRAWTWATWSWPTATVRSSPSFPPRRKDGTSATCRS